LRHRFAAFFPASLLDAVHIQPVPAIPNPTFYQQLIAAGLPIPLDFSQMWGITFVDTILIAEPKVSPASLEPLLFHECVHVVQYALLGVDRFMEQYVTGWAANGQQYDRIPLEVEAYQLESAFTKNPRTPFSVEAAVQKRLRL
jgi:hypothetical protein